MVFICTLSLPVYADSDSSSGDGYSAIISDIPTTCPTCGAALHASWRSTSGAEVELQISEAGKITIPAGAGVYAHFKLYCTNCGYSKSETRILGLDWGSEHPGNWEVKQAPSGIGRKDLPGYADDNGTPSVSSAGDSSLVVYPSVQVDGTFYDYPASISNTPTNDWNSIYRIDGLNLSVYWSEGRYDYLGHALTVRYTFVAPFDGVYFFASPQTLFSGGYTRTKDSDGNDITAKSADTVAPITKFSKSLKQG